MQGTSQKIEFFIPCLPPTTTKQTGFRILTKKINHRKVNFIGTPAGSKSANTKRYLSFILKQYAPKMPIESPRCLTVCYAFPKLKTKKNSDRFWHITNPDCSNIIKMLEDVLEELSFFKNDAGNSRIIVEKIHAERTGIYIKIEQMPTSESPLPPKQLIALSGI